MDRIIEETDGRCITLLLLKLAELLEDILGPKFDAAPRGAEGAATGG